MKSSYKNIPFICLLGLLFFCSCSDSEDVMPNTKHFVRLGKAAITISVGEEFLIKPSVDSISGGSYDLRWSVADADLASIEKTDGQAGLLKGLQPGTTTVKVETADHKLKYFADLTVLEGAPALKLLTIGSGLANQSANEALIQLANSTGKNLVICNIYQDNASLYTHIRSMVNGNKAYAYKRIDKELKANNQRDMGIRDVIGSENWDFIAIEESVDSAGFAKGYDANLASVIENCKAWSTNPHLKIFLHQPWAYSKESVAPGFQAFDRDQDKMFNAIAAASKKAAGKVDKIVPVGTAIQNGRTTYLGESVVNGDINLNATSGQVIAALTWYEVLFGVDVTKAPINIEGMSENVNNMYKQSAHAAVTAPDKVTDMVDFKSANNFVLEVPIYIDFGEAEEPLPFNFFADPEKPLSNLVDEDGQSTYFNIETTTPFGRLKRTSLVNSLGLPDNVCQDMFFVDCRRLNQPFGGLKMTNMNSTKKYTFIFYGSIKDKNTGTHYKVKGVNEGEADLNTERNADAVATIEGIQPRPDGTIDIELSMAPFNTHWAGFTCVNALIIVPEGYTGLF